VGVNTVTEYLDLSFGWTLEGSASFGDIAAAGAGVRLPAPHFTLRSKFRMPVRKLLEHGLTENSIRTGPSELCGPNTSNSYGILGGEGNQVG
jgi:hypothetical protein